MSETRTFLGKGWSFPPSFSTGGRDVDMASGIEDIRQSLEILFKTRLGERIMQEEYGSILVEFQFEDLSAGILNRLKHKIEEAVLYHEARIDLLNVHIDLQRQSEGILLIQLDIRIRANNSRFNLVFPFYLQEANL